jgi:hypothetical protein
MTHVARKHVVLGAALAQLGALVVVLLVSQVELRVHEVRAPRADEAHPCTVTDDGASGTVGGRAA